MSGITRAGQQFENFAAAADVPAGTPAKERMGTSNDQDITSSSNPYGPSVAIGKSNGADGPLPVEGQKREAAARLRGLNPTRFLCRSEVRKFLLQHAERTRSHRFSRVSEETLVEINEAVRQILIARVGRLPSKGKTI